MVIIKRDGTQVPFETQRIITAIENAMKETGNVNIELCKAIASSIHTVLESTVDSISVEQIQDQVENELMASPRKDVAKAYVLYRQKRTEEREKRSQLFNIGKDIVDTRDMDLLRENANLNGESFSGKMSKFGSEFSKWQARFELPKQVLEASDQNKVYIHDLDQYILGTTNCIFIPFGRLLREGFHTSNGTIRPPQSIMTAAALVAIIFQNQQNAQYGGVSGNMIDHDLAPFVGKSFIKHFKKAQKYIESERTGLEVELTNVHIENEWLMTNYPKAYEFAYIETVNETYQAAESMIHNLNTMSSRAGGQIPFSSVNYGTCTSPEGRLVISALLDSTIRGLGNGETPIFPQQIFKCKNGVNTSPEDPNYDLFLKSIECSSKRLYPNFANVDAPFNLQYYVEGDPDTEFATMGCRTRNIGDRFGWNHLSGKGNLSFNTINLVRLGLENGIYSNNRTAPDEAGLKAALIESMEAALTGLFHRFELQAVQKAKASDFMMREGVWKDGRTLRPHDQVRELIKHGSISIGFIGLAECMKAMYGKHHGQDAAVYEKAVELIRVMREHCDKWAEEHDLNVTLFATPAEGLAGKFVKSDNKLFGTIEGVTDREYYTNSFHVPVYYDISAAKKIELEAPFHELCNAGAISYVELDGNARNNLDAFRKIVQYALQQNISYFSVNHPIDRCPACGYEGVIGDACPNCAASEADHTFSRLRRVTGYLTGSYTERFNSAKQAEVRDRVKHL
ncbi:anaerobic ribonucleoside triphosphate reductase [Paenibacillus sp. N1-5-1-14]|uniref:anaerobic ribonucleoside triphosphate reductase n=1 Tax=Paenibacillus radicibacter TaxID=2972488 RepID=UPI002158BDF6|nr:anaerobic ribonucleoside triphosphate reductase [Paenibacillus radicibacter]MCR8641067.1 anaerobic ribonucleoside triphosphate reductase [Paenibacillus radicibacter]